MESYYEILGVPRDSDAKQIRQAYRRLARRHHPDLNPGDKKAEQRFKRINEAYGVLSDPESRRKYDRYGTRWKQAEGFEAQYGQGRRSPFGAGFRTWRGGEDTSGFDPFSGLDDLLGVTGWGGAAGQGGARTAVRLESSVSVSLEEAFAGARRLVTIPGPEGERRIEVTIPAGVDTGSIVHIGLGDGQDLFIKVEVQAHPRFQRKGADLYTEIEVPLVDAILGGETEVGTLTGKVRLKVPAESQNGQRIRLSGQGMPARDKPKSRGDLFVTLRPRLPQGLTKEERELFRKLKSLGREQR